MSPEPIPSQDLRGKLDLMSSAPSKPSRKPVVLIAGIGVVALIIGFGAGFGVGKSSSDDGPAVASPKSTKTTAKPTADASLDGPKLDEDGRALPNLGDDALKVGETRFGTAVSTTVLKVKDDYRDGGYQAPDNGGRYLGVQVKSCLTDTSVRDIVVSWSDFEAANADGESFPAASSMYEGFPNTPYPFSESALKAGCRKGWLLIEVPKGTKVDRVRLAPDDPSAEWIF